MAMPVVVWNQHGAQAGERISAAVPGVQVVDIGLAPRKAPRPAAQVLFAAGRYSASEAGWARGIRWVHAGSSGVETFPPDLLRTEIVTCSRGVRSPAIAEFVLGAILSAVKDMPRIWQPAAKATDFALGALSGVTLGLIGVGTIGRAVAERAAPFGMRVLGARRSATVMSTATSTATSTVMSAKPIEIVDMRILLAESDHLVIAAPATAESHHLLDSEAFRAMKPGLHLINVSRGALVDHEALVDALQRGQVGLATLDVTDPEPLPADHPLREHPRVRLSPHVSYMDGAPNAVVDFFIANLRRYLAGLPLDGVVDTGLGY